MLSLHTTTLASRSAVGGTILYDRHPSRVGVGWHRPSPRLRAKDQMQALLGFGFWQAGNLYGVCGRWLEEEAEARPALRSERRSLSWRVLASHSSRHR